MATGVLVADKRPAPGYLINDDFNGPADQGPDPAVWDRRGGKGYGYGIEMFQPDADLVALDGNGNLRVSARKNPDGSWRGGIITSKATFKTGIIEFRAQVGTSTDGRFPAIWGINEIEGTLTNEIDWMEVFPGGRGGSDGPGTQFSVHDWTRNNLSNHIPNTDVTRSTEDNAFHTWKIEQLSDRVSLWVDGTFIGAITAKEMGGTYNSSDWPMKAVMDMAVRPSWSPASVVLDPATTHFDMLVDYFRVRKFT